MLLLAAPMLAGLILASVPILIHLWNRRRFRLVEWAPMKYIRLTVQTNRRRMRVERLLLLAVRVGVVALLFLALARPAFPGSGVGGWLAARSRGSRVIVIDDSMSMGYFANRHSVFERAKEAAAQVLASTGSQDSVTLVLTSRPDQPLVRDGGAEQWNKAMRAVQALSPTDAACDWPAVFKQIDPFVSGASHPERELILITDLRRSGWAAVGAQAGRWAGPTFGLKVIDVGSRATDNTVLARFEQEEPLALPGVPVRLRASVRNDTAAVLRGATAALEVDGQPRPLVLPDLPQGRTIEVPLTVTFDKPGRHVLKLSLPDDALPADNTRWLSVNVRPEVRVAMIDGQTGTRAFESSTDFVQLALTAGADLWLVGRRAEADWQRTVATADAQLAGADVIVLSNVTSLSPQQVAVLENLVGSGTGLMIFPGEQAQPAVYNQALYRDGAGLLPGRLARVVEASPGGLTIDPAGDSPLAPMARLAPEALSRVRPKKFLPVVVDENGKDRDARVLARWNEAEARPAVTARRFGRGRVVFWTVTADRQWSDWPVDPTYVLAVRSATSAIVRPEQTGTNFTAGETISYPVAAGEVIQTPTVTGPEPAAPAQPLAVVGQVLRGPVALRAGPYVLSWKNEAGAPQSRTLCASFSPVESNLQPIAEDELAKLVAPLAPSVVRWGTAVADAQAPQRGREVWRNVMLGVLVLAAFEAVLATWVGRER